MLIDIVSVKPLNNYRLWIKFSDNQEGELDLRSFIRMQGVFEPLKHEDFFKQVSVNSELGTIVWPNGADLDPDVLYAIITGEDIPNFESRPGGVID